MILINKNIAFACIAGKNACNDQNFLGERDEIVELIVESGRDHSGLFLLFNNFSPTRNSELMNSDMKPDRN
jgi:hypothetical protein